MSELAQRIAEAAYGEDIKRIMAAAPEVDALTHLPAASVGDLEALRQIADQAAHIALHSPLVDPVVTLSEGLVAARLAAEHGQAEDKRRVICMLSLTSALCNGENVLLREDSRWQDKRAARLENIMVHTAGEAIARLEMLADEGDENAAILLASGTAGESDLTIALAKGFHSIINSAAISPAIEEAVQAAAAASEVPLPEPANDQAPEAGPAEPAEHRTYAYWRSELAESNDPAFWPIEAIDRLIAENRAQFWCDGKAAMVTRLVRYPGGAETLEALACAGDLDALLNSVAPACEASAKRANLSHMMVPGRRGWSRALKALGWRHYQDIVIKDLAGG